MVSPWSDQLSAISNQGPNFCLFHFALHTGPLAPLNDRHATIQAIIFAFFILLFALHSGPLSVLHNQHATMRAIIFAFFILHFALFTCP